MPDCACLAGSGDDVTGSRGGWELCVRSVEVGALSASRLASVTRLSIVGRSSSELFAAARKLINVRRLQIIDAEADVDYWMRLFAAFDRLDTLTIRNSSSTAAATAATLSPRRLFPKLRKMDLSGCGLEVVELRSLQKLRNVHVLDLSGNSLRQLTDANNTACIDSDKDGATSVSALNSTSGPLSPSTKPLVEMCRPFNTTSNIKSLSLRVFNASRNQIDVIEVGLFDRKSSRKLELLDLSFNQLSLIVNGTFTDLYALRSINLSHNVIGDVEVDAFTMTSDDEQPGTAADAGYQATGKQPEEQYYISLASCTRGWLSIQVL